MNHIDSRRIWGILVTHAGAEDTDSNWVSFRQWFDGAFARGGDEYRFIGSLGFGGKFWLHHSEGMYVTCYREDETPARKAAIKTTNDRLATVWAWQTPAVRPWHSGLDADDMAVMEIDRGE